MSRFLKPVQELISFLSTFPTFFPHVDVQISSHLRRLHFARFYASTFVGCLYKCMHEHSDAIAIGAAVSSAGHLLEELAFAFVAYYEVFGVEPR